MGMGLYFTYGALRVKAPRNIGPIFNDNCSAYFITEFRSQDFQQEDFEFYSADDEPGDFWLNGKNRNMSFWLLGRHGYTQLMDVNPKMRGDATDSFRQWYDSCPPKTNHLGEYFDEVCAVGANDSSKRIYTVLELMAFDYDQVAPLFDEKSDHYDNPRYYRPENGKTYRELFDPAYFDMLEFCKEHKWDFIIVGTDQ